MKKKKTVLIFFSAFIIPILIVGLHLIYMEATHPGYFSKGENFLLVDMSSQYNSLYSYIQDVFLGKASIFYSFGKSIGGNMASTIGYYLGSPFNILYIFFSKQSIPLCTFIIYLIKIGLCGLFMNIFLSKRLKQITWSTIIFSTSYALCAYTVNYYFNNMWLDVVLMSPIVMYGIYKLINKKSICLYTISLSISIISNFYIAYMLCIFSIIYFIFELFNYYKIKENTKEIRKCIINFILASLLAVGISCFILLPAITDLSQIMRTPTFASQLKYDFRGLKNNIFNDILSKLFIGSHSRESVLSRNRPNIYFGLFPLILCYFYYFNHNIKIKEKIYTFAITLIFFLSFFIPILNVIWHGFSFPNGYICRFSFLFCFFMIFTAYKTFTKMDKIKIIPSIIFLIIYIAISKYISTQYLVFLEKKDIILSCIFVVIYIILLIILSRVKKYIKIFRFLLIIIVLTEIFINFSDCFITNQKMKIISSYQNFNNNICPEIQNLDNEFYRVDGNYYFSYLDSMICRTNGITSSLSTNYGNLYQTFYDYGFSLTYTTVTEDENKLPIMDSILGLKYFYSKEEICDGFYNTIKTINTKKYNYVYKRWKDKEIYLYENPYALKLGFLVNKDYKKNYKRNDNKIEKQNSLMKSLTGNNKNVLHKYKGTYLGDNTYKFYIDNNSKYLYLSYNYDLSINWSSYESIYINNNFVTSGTSDNIGIMKIPNFYNNQEIELKIGDNNEMMQRKEIDSLVIYSFDFEQFEKDINSLKTRQAKNILVNNNVVKMKVKVTDYNNILFLSIPYDKGWNIYVDGKKTDYFNIADGFIGINLSKGNHNISMKYSSPNFKLGLFISLISTLILVIIYKKKRIKELN